MSGLKLVWIQDTQSESARCGSPHNVKHDTSGGRVHDFSDNRLSHYCNNMIFEFSIYRLKLFVNLPCINIFIQKAKPPDPENISAVCHRRTATIGCFSLPSIPSFLLWSQPKLAAAIFFRLWSPVKTSGKRLHTHTRSLLLSFLPLMSPSPFHSLGANDKPVERSRCAPVRSLIQGRVYFFFPAIHSRGAFSLEKRAATCPHGSGLF